MAAGDSADRDSSLRSPLLLSAGLPPLEGVRRAPPRDKGVGVNVIVQASEWDAAGSSSSDEDAPDPLVEGRRERYERMWREQQAAISKDARFAATTHPSSGRTSLSHQLMQPHWRRCVFFLFSFVENTMNNVAFVLLLLVEQKTRTVCWLLPGQLLFMVMESYQVCKDRSIAQKRQSLLLRTGQRPCSCLCRPLVAVAFDAFALLVLGCLSFYQLLRARSSWKEKDTSGFVAEVEAQGNVVEDEGPHIQPPLARHDTHISFIGGVPRVLVLTTVLLGRYFSDPVASVFLLAALLSLLAVVRAVVLFDYNASRHVKKQYDTASSSRFEIAHCSYRLFEILGRVLVLVAYISLAVRALTDGKMAVVILNIGDFVSGIAMLWWVSKWGVSARSLKVLILSIPIFIVDVSHYIDEHGYATAARKLSRRLYAIRLVQFFVASAIYWTFACLPNQKGVLEGNGATILLTVMVVVHVACFAMRNSKVGQAGGDIFTAATDGKVDALEEMLREGIDPDMRQGDSTQQAPLHMAASHKQLQCVLCLLRHGADPSAVDSQQENPLHVACRGGDPQIVKALLPRSISSMQPPWARRHAELLQHRNYQGLRPLEVLNERAPSSLRELLLDEEKREAPAGGRRQNRLVQNCGKKDLEALFGPMMGGEHYGLRRPSSEPRLSRLARVGGSSTGRIVTSDSGSGLTSFMFSRGVGEQLAQVLLDMHEPADQLSLSSLKATGTLGSGGFGKVIKVTDVRNGHFYAMKLQRKDQTTKFAMREAKALHRSNHAFIVRLIRVFQTRTFYGILMECCETDLNVKILDHTTSDGRTEGLPKSQVARYSACVLLALEYLHQEKRVVFRDLKPENILVTSKEAGDLAKLTDFGLACSVDRSTVTGSSGSDPDPEEDQDDDDGDGFLRADSDPEAAFGLHWNAEGDGARSPVRQESSPVAGTLGFMAHEVFEPSRLAEGESEEVRVNRLLARDWYALGCCILLMLLGERGNNVARNGRRKVLLPPLQEAIPRVLEGAFQDQHIDEEALWLASSLTTASWSERAGLGDARRSGFLREAVAELEAHARHGRAEDGRAVRTKTPSVLARLMEEPA